VDERRIRKPKRRVSWITRLTALPCGTFPGLSVTPSWPGRGGKELRCAGAPGGGAGIHQRNPGVYHQAEHHHRQLQQQARSDFHTAFPAWKTNWNTCAGWSQGIRRDATYNVWNARDDELFNDIPAFFQEGLLTERDSHGNFQFSQVETDKVLLTWSKTT
jgi:hypothetical protein